jgi:Protein of unknown function (DUF4238)
MTTQISHDHHYVPEWYQKRFLVDGATGLHRLALKPARLQTSTGHIYYEKNYLRRPPSRLFCTKDLYMLRFGHHETDGVEKGFFGMVDRLGCQGVEFFAKFNGPAKGIQEAYHDILRYMGAQRFRTPRGLDWLKGQSKRAHQTVLFLLTQIFRAHETMWMEGIWEIVRADDSPTKFIVSDSPVTFYNNHMPPGLTPYPGTEEWDKAATRTIFPLGLDRCLIITHVQFVRNPHIKANIPRSNARSFSPAVAYFNSIQSGRQLEEIEVKKINFILKRAATNYIAAGKKEWLYPEEGNRTFGWAKMDDDWFLLPDPWRVGFHSKVLWGMNDGSAWSLDAYGRNPRHPDYDDRKQHEREWISQQRMKQEWALKRKGKARGRTSEFGDHVSDKMNDDFLASYDVSRSRR